MSSWISKIYQRVLSAVGLAPVPIDYMVQKDDYSCGVISTVNAIRWAGNDGFDNRMLWEQLKCMSECVPRTKNSKPGGRKGGSTHYGMNAALNTRPEFTVHARSWNPGIVVLRKHLQNGGGVVLSCKNYRKKKFGHAMFISEVSKDGRWFTIINYNSGDESTLVHSKVLAKILRASKKSDWNGQAWLLYKNPNWKEEHGRRDGENN